MDIKEIIENLDGSATLTFDMNKDEVRMLIQYAINNILKEYIEKEIEKEVKE